MTQLIIQFRSELDVTYGGGVFRSPSAKAIQPINDILRSYADAQVEPVFGGETKDVPPHMRNYYQINLEDENRARALERLLQQQTSLEAAYIKPPAELP